MRFEVMEKDRLNYILLAIMLFLMVIVCVAMIFQCCENIGEYQSAIADITQYEGAVAEYQQIQNLRNEQLIGDTKLVILCMAVASAAYLALAVRLLMGYCSVFKQIRIVGVITLVVLYIMGTMTESGFEGGLSLKFLFGYLGAVVALLRYSSKVEKAVNADNNSNYKSIINLRDIAVRRNSPKVRELNDSAEMERIFNAPVEQPASMQGAVTEPPAAVTNSAKGMWFCPSCGSLNEGTAVCSSCGKEKD